MSCTFLSASPAAGKLVTNNTPSYVASAKNLGAENPAKLMEVSIWLQLHNRSEFDALTQSLYDRTSPNYHHWLRRSDFASDVAVRVTTPYVVNTHFPANVYDSMGILRVWPGPEIEVTCSRQA